MKKQIAENYWGYWLLKSTLLSYLVTIALLLFLAFLMFRFQLDEEKAAAGITGIYIISCLTGGFYTGKMARSKKFFWGILSGIIYSLLLLGITLLLERELNSDMGQVLTTMLLCAGGGMLGGMIA